MVLFNYTGDTSRIVIDIILSLFKKNKAKFRLSSLGNKLGIIGTIHNFNTQPRNCIELNTESRIIVACGSSVPERDHGKLI